jgi:hypothetical protein
MHAPGVMEIDAGAVSAEFRVESVEFRLEKPKFSKGGD